MLLFTCTVAVAETSLVAHYGFEGNLNNNVSEKYALKSAEAVNFGIDEYIRSTPNKTLAPFKKLTETSHLTSEVPGRFETGMTVSGFYMKSFGGNDFGGMLMGFGSTKWNEPGLLICMPSGLLGAKVGKHNPVRHKRLEVGVWHHVALVVQKTAGDSVDYRLYLNGEAIIDEKSQYLPDYGLFRLVTLAGKENPDVSLDEVKVYKRALSQAEVAAEAKLSGKKMVPKINWTKVDYSGRHVAPAEGEVTPAGDLGIHVLTAEWICVTGDYSGFLRERFTKECGEFLKKLADDRENVKDWVYNAHYGYAGKELLMHYRPGIARNFQSRDYFTLQRGNTRTAIIDNAYWINAIGQMRVPDVASGRETFVHEAADVAHFAFLKLGRPMQNGERYSLRTTNGEAITFDYDESKTISWAIKVNQVGYLPDAGRKYGYLGAWLGAKGPLDLSRFQGKEFQLVDASNDRVAFTGKVALRQKDLKNMDGFSITGEDVYQMDFSPFTGSGRYYLNVPGAGRSWTFAIGQEALGESFYVQTRGLYHKRCGIAKCEPYTKWPSGECHKHSYRGGFPPDAHNYQVNKKGEPYGIFDEDNKPYKANPFHVVADTATDEKVDVWGGWHDAGDFDRRPYHFEVVRDLLSAYLMFPENFADGQLNLPESGNGIPDIVDEAVWGMAVWLRAQNDKGGVGCWLEAKSHPTNPDPALDKDRYYLALPTRESTLDYAGHAALLAVALRKCGVDKQAAVYLESARKAYDYALNPDNTVTSTWKHTTNKKEEKTLTFRENPKLDAGQALFGSTKEHAERS
jgi:hypothetical protein